MVCLCADDQVMHLLIARGPLELELPHARFSMTVAEYSAWIDSMVIASSDAAGSVAGSEADRHRC